MVTIKENLASIVKYEALVSVNENVMVFRLKRRLLSIFGKQLKVIFFSKEEVWIQGEIQQVIFDEK